MNEIASALMTGDVNIKYIFTMQSRIKKRVEEVMKREQGVEMRKVVQEVRSGCSNFRASWRN